MRCEEVYEQLYHQKSCDMVFCPYRISPLGAHIVHQYCKFNDLSVDKGVHMAFNLKQNGIIGIQSLNFLRCEQFFVNDVPEKNEWEWADYLLPIGVNLSSDSAIICFYLRCARSTTYILSCWKES